MRVAHFNSGLSWIEIRSGKMNISTYSRQGRSFSERNFLGALLLRKETLNRFLGALLLNKEI